MVGATDIIARVQVSHNRIAVQGRDKNVEERISEGVRLGLELKLSLNRAIKSWATKTYKSNCQCGRNSCHETSVYDQNQKTMDHGLGAKIISHSECFGSTDGDKLTL